MLPIYICEDVEIELKYLQKTIDHWINTDNLDAEVVCAVSDPTALIVYLQDHPGQSMYFLDVDLKSNNYNGFTLAKKIREYDQRGYIVVVTTHAELQMEVFRYHVEALDYILKDDFSGFREKVRECLKIAYRLHTTDRFKEKKFLKLKSVNTDRSFCVDEIYSIEVRDHKITVFGEFSITELTYPLDRVMEQVKQLDNSSLFRSHKSCIVNLSHISKIEDKKIVLSNGHICPVSTRNIVNCKKAYRNYISQNDVHV